MMLTYILSILVSAIFCGIMLWKYRERVVPWELTIPFAVSLLTAFLMTMGFKHSLTADTEYLGGPCEKVEYYEEWRELVHYECNCRCVSYSRNSDGTQGSCNNRVCDTCTRIDYHPPYWVAYARISDENLYSIIIDQADYSRIAQRFGTPEEFRNMMRMNQVSIGDGNMYSYSWDGSYNTIEPMTVENSYENRVMASDLSAFGFTRIAEDSPEREGLFDYPPVQGYTQRVILGNAGSNTNAAQAEEYFRVLNARLGYDRQVKIFVLLYRGESEEIAMRQQSYWYGGNKNEFIVAIGLDNSNNIQWSHSFSWMENPILAIETDQFLADSGTLDLMELAHFLERKIPLKWERRSFESFDYITVYIPGWAVFVTLLVVTLLNCALAWFIINNEWHEGVVNRYHNNYGRNRYARW